MLPIVGCNGRPVPEHPELDYENDWSSAWTRERVEGAVGGSDEEWLKESYLMWKGKPTDESLAEWYWASQTLPLDADPSDEAAMLARCEEIRDRTRSMRSMMDDFLEEEARSWAMWNELWADEASRMET